MIVCSIVFILGSAGILKRNVLPYVASAGATFAIYGFLKAVRPWAGEGSLVDPTATGTLERCFWAILITVSLGNLLFGYAPPTGEDELQYQLTLPSIWVAQGRIVSFFHNHNSFFPLNAQLLYAGILLCSQELAVKAMVWISGLLTAAAFWTFARYRLQFDRQLSLIGLALFYTMPFITSLNGTTSSDLLCLFFEMLSLAFIWSWHEDARLGAVAWAGFFAGFAMGTRIYAGAWVGAVALFLIWHCRSIRPVLLFTLATTLVFLPWPVRNWYLTGNPLYPKALWPGAASDPYMAAIMVNRSGFWRDLAYLPLQISGKNWIWGMGALPVALAPFSLLKISRSRDVQRLWFLLVLTVIIYFVLFPWRTYTRYMGGIFPFVALLALYGFKVLRGLFKASRRAMLYAWVGSVLIIPNLLFSVALGVKRLPYLTGRQSEEDYLQKRYKCYEGYEMMHYLRTAVMPSTIILYLGPLVSPAYYFPGRHYYGMETFHPRFYNTTTANLARSLKRQNIQSVLSIRDYFHENADGSLEWIGWKNFTIQLPALVPPFFQKQYETKDSILYEIHAIPRRDAQG
jgi:hypothetical protein